MTNTLIKGKLLLVTLTHLVVSLMCPQALATSSYSITTIGLTDAEHTRDDGYKKSRITKLNNIGQVIGQADRYNGSNTHMGYSAWFHNGSSTVNIGLTGTEHTRDDGFKYNIADFLKETGRVIGRAGRYNSSLYLGQSAWLYNGSSTVNIGLIDSEHTRDNGFRYSNAGGSNDSGQVVGYSQRYNNGSANLGRSAWLFNGSSTNKIGLTGSNHTRDDGYKDSLAIEINGAGQVHGQSNRYSGAVSMGQSAWLYNGSSTVNIGLTDIEHTKSDGYRYSETYGQNEAGQIIGSSQRFNNSNAYLGYSAWLYNGVSTVNIGLTGAEHTRDDGYKYSQVYEQNELGQVLGRAARYNSGNTYLGRSAWLYNGSSTVNVGLTGAEHTRDDGTKYSVGEWLNESGHVLGIAHRYNSSNIFMGHSAWLYSGSSTANVGLTGAEHTRDDGYKYSSGERLNESGHVTGNSDRYNGSNAFMGVSAWFYNGSSTSNIGLTGAMYTRDDGYKQSDPNRLSDSGQVLGNAYKYNGGSAGLGRSAWLYDMSLNQTFDMTLSARSDGYAYSQGLYLGEDGLVLGEYTLFDEMDVNLGERAFIFTIEDGLSDLGLLVDESFTQEGWDFLAEAIRANDMGQIFGHGLLDGMLSGQMAYLLDPTPVPVPAAVWLFSSGLLGLIGYGRRRQTV